MANELNIVLAASGETVTAQRYAAGAAVGSAINLTEISTSGVYTGDMTGDAGTYLLVFSDGTENVGVGTIVWSGTAEVPVSTLTTGDLPSVPTASDIRDAVWAASTKEITGGTVDTLTNAPSVPSAATIASQVRTELGTELANLDAAVSSRLADADYTAPANSDITAIKAKTDALDTTRLGNVSTVATTGAQLAAALS